MFLPRKVGRKEKDFVLYCVKNHCKGGNVMDPARKLYLDNIRWMTVVLVVIYHVVYMFNGVQPFGVIGPFREHQLQDCFQYLVYPWFMALLFVVSGMSARYYLQSHTTKQFLKDKTRKLLVPSTIGLFVFQWLLGIFAGLIKCADCGWSLAYGENKQNKNPYGYYHCSKNGQGLRQCSMHYIRYDVLYAYVLARLQYWSMLAQKDEDNLLKRLLNASDRERNSAKKKQAAELKKAEKRKAEVDGLFAKMYEDWSAGRITEYNFNMLSEKYQNEQKELETKIRQLHETMEAAVQTAADAEKWIALMKQYVNPVELTAELLNTLIEKITVHEAVKGEDGSREQEVEIYYRFIGKID